MDDKKEELIKVSVAVSGLDNYINGVSSDIEKGNKKVIKQKAEIEELEKLIEKLNKQVIAKKDYPTVFRKFKFLKITRRISLGVIAAIILFFAINAKSIVDMPFITRLIGSILLWISGTYAWGSSIALMKTERKVSRLEKCLDTTEEDVKAKEKELLDKRSNLFYLKAALERGESALSQAKEQLNELLDYQNRLFTDVNPLIPINTYFDVDLVEKLDIARSHIVEEMTVSDKMEENIGTNGSRKRIKGQE